MIVINSTKNPVVPILFSQGLDHWEPDETIYLLRNIRKPWEDFLEDWGKIQEILPELEEVKKVDLEENIQDYLFKSGREDHKKLKEAVMGRKVLTAYERTLEEGIGIGEMNKALETARRMKEE